MPPDLSYEWFFGPDARDAKLSFILEGIGCISGLSYRYLSGLEARDAKLPHRVPGPNAMEQVLQSLSRGLSLGWEMAAVGVGGRAIEGGVGKAQGAVGPTHPRWSQPVGSFPSIRVPSEFPQSLWAL